MPRAYAYLRVSTQDQADSGLGLGAQKEACQAYYDALLAKTHQWGDYYQDPAISGRKPLLQRPAGLALNLAAGRDDAIIVAKTDRAFRSSVDTILTMDLWRKRGVAVHLLDLRVDTSSAVGQLLLTVMAGFAQFERTRISERTRDALRHRIATKGMWINGTAPLGYRIARTPGSGKRYVAPWPVERVYLQKVWMLRHVEKASWRGVLTECVRRRICSPRTRRPPAGFQGISVLMAAWVRVCAREGLDPLVPVEIQLAGGLASPASQGRVLVVSESDMNPEVQPNRTAPPLAGQGA